MEGHIKMNSFVLTKFWKKEKYRNWFVEGKLRFSSMTEYTQIFEERKLMAAASAGDKDAEEKLKQSRGAQIVPFEGTMGSIDLGEATIEDAQLGTLLADPRLRAKGYDYSNVMCFCKMIYTATPFSNGYSLLNWEEPDMHDFGKYGVIITDQQEFLRRMNKGFETKRCKYLAGSVAYHRLTLRGKELKEAAHITHLLYPDLVDLDKANPNAPEFDAFDKWDLHKGEFEWRILANKYGKNGVAPNIEPLDIDFGDLSDIVVPFESSSLVEQMSSLFKAGRIRPSTDIFHGNIKRDEMRKSFYKLGNNQGYEIISLGFGAQYF